MENDTQILPLLADREMKLSLNWIFTAGIIIGNLNVILLVLGSQRLRRSSKYILVASLAFADLSDGGCFLPMWTDVLIQMRVQFSCQARYLAGALGFSITCVCSLSVVALNTDFTFRRSFPKYKGWIRFFVISILLLVCWMGPCLSFGPFITSGMNEFYPRHCYFTLDQDRVSLFLLLAFFIPSGSVLVSTFFVLFVHWKTREDDAYATVTTEKFFPLDVVIASCLTLLFYVPFGILLLSTYQCDPKNCYQNFVSRFLVIGNLVYAKSAILPWIWLIGPQMRKEIKGMFCLEAR